jgi:hypothetical protein
MFCGEEEVEPPRQCVPRQSQGTRYHDHRLSTSRSTKNHHVACSAYVDLNPVRAGVAETPEESQYTSIQTRIESEKGSVKAKGIQKRINKRSRKGRKIISSKDQMAYVRKDDWLAPLTINTRSVSHLGPMPSKSTKRASDKGFLTMSFDAYVQFVDWTGRQIRSGKKGRIPKEAAPILDRIGYSSELWVDVVKRFGKIFSRAAGRPESLAQEAIKRGQVRLTTHGSPMMA